MRGRMNQSPRNKIRLDKIGWMGAGALIALLWPMMGLAAGDGGFQGLDPSQESVLILLAIIGVAYLVTHLVLERVAEKFGFVTGVEYIVLGAILGPVAYYIPDVQPLIDDETLGALTPAIVLGTGSLGLWGGLHIDFKKFGALRARALKSAMFISLATLLVTVGVAVLALYYTWAPDGILAVMPALLCMGTIAVVADASPLRSMAAYLGAEGQATEFGALVAGYCSAIGIIAFGLIFCFYNTTAVPFEVDAPFVWLVWFGIHLLLGSVLGLVFATFLRRDFSDDKIITVVIGMVIFSSGFAYYLHLSPIFVNFILGIVLINTGRHADHVESRLRAIQRPLYIVLFFFAGAGWKTEGVPWWTFALVVAYVIVRRAGRLTGSLLATRIVSQETYGAGLGRALLAPGALSVAMLLNFDQVFSSSAYAEVLYDGILTAIVVTEIVAYPMTRSWLIDVADVAPPEQRRRQTEAG